MKDYIIIASAIANVLISILGIIGLIEQYHKLTMRYVVLSIIVYAVLLAIGILVILSMLSYNSYKT